MAALSNNMWEKFAQAMARGVNQTKSALEAGYNETSAHVRGCELAKKPAVKERIEELRKKADKLAVQAVACDREWVLRELVATYEAARAAKNQTAANRALELIGKEQGMFIDRKMDVKSPLEGLNTQQLQQLMALVEDAGPLPTVPVLDLQAMQSVQVHQPAVDLVNSETANAQPV